MIALLGSALGFGTSFLPQVLGFFQKRQDHKNRIEEMRLQGELASLGVAHDLQRLDKQAEIAETKALYEFANPSSGFAAGLSASVRPVITYLFFGVFLAVKAVILLKAMEAGGDWKDAVPLMFDTETQALFSAIIAFWFGQRSVNKFMRANK
jgi:hypothetical protein|tara:strand:+ start:563 stop:1018 length:456 start_codon:yes stop_codon:yes gene_type:complete